VVAGVCWGGCSIGSTGAVVAAGAAGTASTGCAFLRQAIADTASKNTSGMVNSRMLTMKIRIKPDIIAGNNNGTTTRSCVDSHFAPEAADDGACPGWH